MSAAGCSAAAFELSVSLQLVITVANKNTPKTIVKTVLDFSLVIMNGLDHKDTIKYLEIQIF